MVNAKWVLATQTIISTGKVRGVTKKRSFYGQADRKGGEGGGGGSAPSALTVSKCENFGPIFPIINGKINQNMSTYFEKSRHPDRKGGGAQLLFFG